MLRHRLLPAVLHGGVGLGRCGDLLHRVDLLHVAGYLQLVLACNDWDDVQGQGETSRIRWIAWRPRSGDWVAALVQSFGTVVFNISTAYAILTAMTTQQ